MKGGAKRLLDPGSAGWMFRFVRKTSKLSGAMTSTEPVGGIEIRSPHQQRFERGPFAGRDAPPAKLGRVPLRKYIPL